MPQTKQAPDYRARIEKLQQAMREFGLQAIVLEPGPAMLYLTGVRWGRSERTFAATIPVNGGPIFVVPAFEEMRAKELIQTGWEIRTWQEDESPFQMIAGALRDRGRVGIDPGMRFFVYDGIRKLAAGVNLVSAQAVLKSAGAN